MPITTQVPRSILRREQLEARTGLPRSTIYKLVQDGDLPPPVRLGGPNSRAVGWYSDQIDEWLASRPLARVGVRPNVKPVV